MIEIKKMLDEDYRKADESFDLKDADAELISFVKEKNKDVNAIYDGAELVGVALIEEGKEAYIYVFIDPLFRQKGIGNKAYKLCEKRIRKSEAEVIMSTYKLDNYDAKKFANEQGYNRKFSSTFMEYSSDQFDLPELSIRNYVDDDFDLAYNMHAVAFHEMRLRVGDFPESVVKQGNEKIRKNWAKTAYERFVYLKEGEIVGYAHISGDEISSVSVDSKYQGQGIGRNFVKFICNKILLAGYQSVGLYCVVGNYAKEIYKSLGFEDVYTADYIIKHLHDK